MPQFSNIELPSPPDHMNLAFLDGHVSFTRVYRPEEEASGETPTYIFSPHREQSHQEE